MTVPALPPGRAAGCAAGWVAGVVPVVVDPVGVVLRDPEPPALLALGGGCTHSARSGPPAL